MKTEKTERLTKEQWLDHGLHNLADLGFTSLKADKLAKSLGVSRGSFYWHFKNLADFHSGILGRWQEVMAESVITMLESQGETAEAKLKQLLTIAMTSERTLEQAIRAWGESDAVVKQAVSDIDTLRMGYVQKLVEEMGVDEGDAAVRARIIYGSYLGELSLHDTMTDEAQARGIEVLLEFARPS